MEITLTAELEAIVKDKIASGQFPSVEKVIEEALHLLKREERRTRVAELRAAIAVGIEQADRGELKPLDAEAIKARGRELFVSRKHE